MRKYETLCHKCNNTRRVYIEDVFNKGSQIGVPCENCQNWQEEEAQSEWLDYFNWDETGYN